MHERSRAGGSVKGNRREPGVCGVWMSRTHRGQKLCKFLTNFYNFQSYWLLFWCRLVLRMRPPLASLAMGLR